MWVTKLKKEKEKEKDLKTRENISDKLLVPLDRLSGPSPHGGAKETETTACRQYLAGYHTRNHAHFRFACFPSPLNQIKLLLGQPSPAQRRDWLTVSLSLSLSLSLKSNHQTPPSLACNCNCNCNWFTFTLWATKLI